MRNAEYWGSLEDCFPFPDDCLRKEKTVLLKLFLKHSSAFLTDWARFCTFSIFTGAADFFKRNRAKDMWHGSLVAENGIIYASYRGMTSSKLLLAAFCAVMLAFSANAKAVTALDFSNGHTLGSVLDGGGSIAQRTAIVNHMIGMALSTSDSFLGRVVFRDGNNFGPLPGPAVFALTGYGTNITIGSGTYSYLLAQYGTEIDSVGQAWYIGNLSGDITIPAATGTMRLIKWKLFGPGVPGVPDGGTTVMLLGAALVALGMARRFLKI